MPVALRHVSDTDPGITRSRRGLGFSYRDAEGRVIRERAVLRRIASLAIPPAWTAVWITPHENGHIQATGRDAKGRKQYRYHARWHAVRDEDKYGRMLAFGEALPRIRSRVNADLAAPALSREHVLAVVVRLLETTYIRVGNEEYARTNGSFGLTTLRNRHVRVDGASLRFQFRGKSGKMHAIAVTDRRLARLVRACRELPGQLLFQYREDDGTTRPIDSTAVNDYLREVTGADFTAKDFRTWAGTLLAASHLSGTGSERVTLTAMLQQVSSQLGNTPAVCRKGYIHPRVLGAHADDALRASWCAACASGRARVGLTREESALLRFLASQSD